MSRWVEITFDCVPLRSVGRLDIPIDASPKYRAFCERIKSAIEKHGSYNTYYLYNAHCRYHLVNAQDKGLLDFRFEGVVLTDAEDQASRSCDLQVELVRETCDWLIEPVVHWFAETVQHSVAAEFDRYVAAGDLEQTRQRIEQVQAASDDVDGFMGMYL
jgi:hypothetical protein